MADHLDINDNSRGTLAHEGNALLVDSKINDPSEVRGGAPATQRSLVKFSGDIVEDGHRDEVALRQFKQTEGEDGRTLEGRGGEESLHLRRKYAGSTDDAMVEIYSATAEGVNFKVPVSAPNLGSSSGANPTFMESPDGRYRTQQQADGNFVSYDMRAPGGPRAIWSAWHGKIG